MLRAEREIKTQCSFPGIFIMEMSVMGISRWKFSVLSDKPGCTCHLVKQNTQQQPLLVSHPWISRCTCEKGAGLSVTQVAIGPDKVQVV